MRALILLVAILPAAVFGAAKTPPDTLSNGLVRVPNAKVALAYVKPGTDWSKYKTILLMPLVVPATARDTAPKGTRPAFGESWILSDKYVAALQKAYDEVTRDELARGGLQFVAAPRADTLVLRAEVLNIRLNAPVEGGVRDMPRGHVITNSTGSMTIAAVLGDGTSGQVIAIAEDQKASAEIWQFSTATGDMAEARRAFRGWAATLRTRLAAPEAGAR